MRESRSYGSVRGARSNPGPYRDRKSTHRAASVFVGAKAVEDFEKSAIGHNDEPLGFAGQRVEPLGVADRNGPVILAVEEQDRTRANCVAARAPARARAQKPVVRRLRTGWLVHQLIHQFFRMCLSRVGLLILRRTSAFWAARRSRRM
jgi:hypothetical protein